MKDDDDSGGDGGSSDVVEEKKAWGMGGVGRGSSDGGVVEKCRGVDLVRNANDEVRHRRKGSEVAIECMLDISFAMYDNLSMKWTTRLMASRKLPKMIHAEPNPAIHRRASDIKHVYASSMKRAPKSTSKPCHPNSNAYHCSKIILKSAEKFLSTHLSDWNHDFLGFHKGHATDWQGSGSADWSVY